MPPFAFDPTRYPSGLGCYLMLDAAGRVIYVGKAKNLRRRLASHFRPIPQVGPRSRQLAAVAEIELTLVSHETVVYNWRVRADKPLLRRFSFIFKPVFEANHRWAMARGEESLKLELLRRRARTPAELAAIPPPPPPTFVRARMAPRTT